MTGQNVYYKRDESFSLKKRELEEILGVPRSHELTRIDVHPRKGLEGLPLNSDDFVWYCTIKRKH